jgi:putative transposase
MSKQNRRTSYPTDRTDAEWQRITPALPERTSPRGQHRVHAYREILNAIFSIVRSGCAWRMLPDDVPPWQTVYHSVRCWQRDGTWVRIHDALRTDIRGAAGRAAEPSAAILDRQSVTTTENGKLEGMMLAKPSTGAHAICWWVPWAWW